MSSLPPGNISSQSGFLEEGRLLLGAQPLSKRMVTPVQNLCVLTRWPLAYTSRESR